MAKGITVITTHHSAIHFPKFNFTIYPGQAKELPKEKEAQEAILACPHIIKEREH